MYSVGLTVFHDVNGKESCTSVAKEPINSFFLKLKKFKNLLGVTVYMFISVPALLKSAAALFWCRRITAGKFLLLIMYVGGTKVLLIHT